MSEVQPTDNQEINIYSLIEILWTGKKIIIGIVSVSLLCLFGYQATQPPAIFNATTEIKYINSIESEQYIVANSFGFFEVSPRQLGDLYFDKLNERNLFEDAIRNFNLLDINKYENDEEYNKAIIALASEIKLIPPQDRDDSDQHWKINFKYNDKEKWIKSLYFLHAAATKSVRAILLQRFESYLVAARIKHDFELEDTQTQIDNAIFDYDRSSSDRITFLLEQSAIARNLGIEKNTIDVNTFNTTQGAILNVSMDRPYYLHGYKAIDKEIELIKLRKDKNAFIPELVKLEKKKRDLEQYKAIKRAEIVFASLPISNADDFAAVSITIGATDYEIQSKNMLLLALITMISVLIGSIYVVITNGLKNHIQNKR